MKKAPAVPNGLRESKQHLPVRPTGQSSGQLHLISGRLHDYTDITCGSRCDPLHHQHAGHAAFQAAVILP